MSTFGEIRQRLIRRLREFDGTDSAGDVISLDEMICEATDEMARLTDAFWFAQSITTVDGQSQYCAPGLYRVTAINYYTTITDPDGEWYPLDVRLPSELDRHLAGWFGSWRGDDTDERPRVALVEGMNQIRLYPTPSVPEGATTAIEVEGYHVPSKALNASGTPVFAGPDQGGSDALSWPLNAFAEDGIPPVIAQLRAEQFPLDGEIVARAKIALPRRNEIIGQLESFAANYLPPARFERRGTWRS